MVGLHVDGGGSALVDRVLQVEGARAVDRADLPDLGSREPDHLRDRRAEVHRVALLQHDLVLHPLRVRELRHFAEVLTRHARRDTERDAGGGAGGDAAPLGARGLGDTLAGALLELIQLKKQGSAAVTSATISGSTAAPDKCVILPQALMMRRRLYF